MKTKKLFVACVSVAACIGAAGAGASLAIIYHKYQPVKESAL